MYGKGGFYRKATKTSSADCHMLMTWTGDVKGMKKTRRQKGKKRVAAVGRACIVCGSLFSLRLCDDDDDDDDGLFSEDLVFETFHQRLFNVEPTPETLFQR